MVFWIELPWIIVLNDVIAHHSREYCPFLPCTRLNSKNLESEFVLVTATSGKRDPIADFR